VLVHKEVDEVEPGQRYRVHGRRPCHKQTGFVDFVEQVGPRSRRREYFEHFFVYLQSLFK